MIISKEVTTAIGSGSTPTSISFGTGLFEITALSMSSVANEVLPTAIFWIRTKAEGGRRGQTQECLMSGYCRDFMPLTLSGSKFVQGPGTLYGLTRLGSGVGSLAVMRIAYRRVKR